MQKKIERKSAFFASNYREQYTIILLAVTVLLLSAGLTISAAPSNMLQNPGFEEGGFPPTGWVNWSGTDRVKKEKHGVSVFIVPAQEARTGSKAIGMMLYGDYNRWGGISQTVPCQGGGRFFASAYARNASPRGRNASGATVAFVMLPISQGDFKLEQAPLFLVH